MEKKRPVNLKIIAMTCMTLFSLFAVFLATAAWFNVVRQVGSTGNGFMTAKMSSVLKQVDIYEQSETLVSNNPYTFNTTPSLTYTLVNGTPTPDKKDVNVSIGEYSILDHKQALFFLFTLDETQNRGNSTLEVITSTKTESSHYHRDNAGKVTRPLESEQNDLSSIVSFTSFTTTNDQIPTQSSSFEIDKDKRTQDSSFKDLTFVNDSEQYTSLIKLSGSDLSSVEAIGVILEYSENLIEHLYSINLGNSSLETTDHILFNHIDFSFYI